MVRQTSIQAYREIETKGLLGKIRWKVYAHLFVAGPLTGSELNRGLGGSGYHKRLSELEQLGVVRLAGKRPCTVTGMECETWDVTATLPTGTVSTSSRPSKAEFAAALAELRVVHGERQQAGLPAFSITLANVLGWVRDKYT